MGKNKNKNRDISMNESVEPGSPDVSFTEEEVVNNLNIEQIKEPAMPEQPEPMKVTTASKTVSSNPTPVRQNTNVDKINNLTSKFMEAYAKKEDTIGVLISICNYLNTTNDPKAFNAFYVWFGQHIEDCMNDQEALRGIHTIQNKRTKTRVEATHQCFIELARVKRSRTGSHFRFSMRAMRAMEISERLALWLIQKAST